MIDFANEKKSCNKKYTMFRLLKARRASKNRVESRLLKWLNSLFISSDNRLKIKYHIIPNGIATIIKNDSIYTRRYAAWAYSYLRPLSIFKN